MWMVAAYQRTHNFTSQVGWLGLWVGGHLALSLHLSNEPGELSQWPRHDDSTINIVIGISIIRPHRIIRTYYEMRPILTDEQRGLSVCLSVCHTSGPCKNG